MRYAQSTNLRVCSNLDDSCMLMQFVYCPGKPGKVREFKQTSQIRGIYHTKLQQSGKVQEFWSMKLFFSQSEDPNFDFFFGGGTPSTVSDNRKMSP